MSIYNNSNYNTFSQYYLNINEKVQSNKIFHKSKLLGCGYVKEFDIINECGWIISILDEKEFYISPETFFYDKNCLTILSLYPGEKVIFEYSIENGIMIAIKVYSCNGNEDKRKRLEEEAWDKYYDEYDECIWCGKSCTEENHEY
uniref:CSD domain-containing protein n=1 Tax=Strongyloides stercoralis TaxID=6248 RepID=A0A0K0EA80_STRER